ncbi:hypothetical protein Tco_1158072 [Tanacetum coccineum]
MHRITNPELIKCLHDNILKSVDESNHSVPQGRGGSFQPNTEENTSGMEATRSWEKTKKVARQRITQSFSLDPEISFPPLGDEDGTEDPMIIEAEIGCHFIHRIYVDEGSALEILYEHCFNRLRLEVKD